MRLLSVALLLGALALPGQPPRPQVLVNPAFAEGLLGGVPRGWAMPAASREAGFRSELAEDPAGQPCAVLFREAGAGGAGNLMQTLDAAPYRGKRIRLRTQLRLEAPDHQPGQGQFWLRVDRPYGQQGFFDNCSGRPVQGSAWTPVELVGDIAADAEKIALGILLTRGNGRLGIRPLTLEILGDTPAPAPPAPLNSRQRANLEAFSRAFSYVRFFHPSREAAQADWNQLAWDGVRAVLGATGPEDLVVRLRTWFAPYAPSAQWLLAGERPQPPTVPAGAACLVRWKHLGFGQGKPTTEPTYHSDLEFSPGIELPGGWADPLATSTLELGGGVQLCLPLVCFAGADRVTLPRALPRPQPPPATEPSAALDAAGALDRSGRLGDIVLAWGIFQHFYPYFAETGADWNRELGVALAAAADAPDGAALQRTLARLTAALKDGHARVRYERAVLAVPSLSLLVVDGAMAVQAAFASAARIPPGSRILSVDGEPAEARRERLAGLISAATPGWLDYRLGEDFLEGPPDQPVRLRLATPDGRILETTLPRDYKPDGHGLHPGPRLEAVAEPRPGLLYVDLDRMTDDSFREALPRLARARGIVFDLRGYPRLAPAFLGHLSDRPLLSPHWNVPVITRPDGRSREWRGSRWTLEPQAPRLRAKVAFLCGGGALSYAETCLAIVEAYHLGTLVGAPSGGSNGDINPFPLPGGYRLSWTGLQVLRHDGGRHHGVGIKPTVPIQPTLKGLAGNRDEVLEKGLDVVS